MATPELTLTAGTNPFEGGAKGTFNITLDKPAPAGGLIVKFNTTGSTATYGEDYKLVAGENVSKVYAHTFTIAAGAKTATLNIAALADKINDPGEKVSVT